MTPRGLVPLVDRLATLRPGNAQAQEICAALEHALMKAVTAGGARAADRAIAALNRRGHQFALAETIATIRRWREALAGGKRVIEISVNVNRHFKSTAVKYLVVREPPRLTKRQLRIHAIQQAFYAKYMAAGRRAYAKGRPVRLGRGDRLALLIGELEADVNNGGFTQYLDNKGRPRALEALRALKQVGARRTAAMLAAAMAPGVTERRLSALDDRFYGVPEDLAVYTMRHLERRDIARQP
jgi:uncharacterized protein DUF4375